MRGVREAGQPWLGLRVYSPAHGGAGAWSHRWAMDGVLDDGLDDVM